MTIDAMLCAELQRIVNCPISHIERYAEFILSKMDEVRILLNVNRYSGGT